jgi:multiple sugar transport system permease protein
MSTPGTATTGADMAGRALAATAPQPARPRSRMRRYLTSPGRIVVALLLFVFGVLMLAPLVWLVVESLTDELSAFDIPPNWLPKPFTLDNFKGIEDLIPFGRMALNSLIVAVISTAGSMVTSVLAAYAFSRLEFRGRQGVFLVMLSALMVPVQMTVIPVFILMRHLHLVDHLAALWLPALINVFAIFFFRQYFSTIPRDLDEAARMDGAGHLWILFRVIVPLSGPAIAAMTILAFEASWNNYFGPLIFLSSPENMTLPIGLVSLQAGQGGSSVVVFAAITAVVIPVLVVFLVFQRAFVASIASAGIRG